MVERHASYLKIGSNVALTLSGLIAFMLKKFLSAKCSIDAFVMYFYQVSRRIVTAEYDQGASNKKTGRGRSEWVMAMQVRYISVASRRCFHP